VAAVWAEKLGVSCSSTGEELPLMVLASPIRVGIKVGCWISGAVHAGQPIAVPACWWRVNPS